MGTIIAALIKANPKRFTLINRRTSPKQRVRRRQTIINLQRTDKRVDRVCITANLISVNAVCETSATISHADQIKSLGGKIASDIKSESNCASTSNRRGWLVPPKKIPTIIGSTGSPQVY